MLQLPPGVAENIAFADAPLLGGENMADGDIANVDPVQAGIEVGGHFAVKKINNHLSGGSGFISRGPTGALGLTITIGKPLAASSRATSSARHFEIL